MGIIIRYECHTVSYVLISLAYYQLPTTAIKCTRVLGTCSTWKRVALTNCRKHAKDTARGSHRIQYRIGTAVQRKVTFHLGRKTHSGGRKSIMEASLNGINKTPLEQAREVEEDEEEQKTLVRPPHPPPLLPSTLRTYFLISALVIMFISGSARSFRHSSSARLLIINSTQH